MSQTSKIIIDFEEWINSMLVKTDAADFFIAVTTTCLFELFRRMPEDKAIDLVNEIIYSTREEVRKTVLH